MKHCKRLVSLALALVLVLGLVPSGLADLLPVPEVYAEDAALTISSAEDWAAFTTDGNSYSGQTVVLGADITLSGDIPSKLDFQGTFDGQGHIITIATGSSIVAPGGADVTKVESLGLFGTLQNATVRNLAIRFTGTIYGSSLRAARLSEGNNAYVGTLYYGILAGTAAGSTIQRVAILNDGSAIYKVVVNHFTSYDVNVGALVGRLFRKSRIEQCYNGVDVHGYRYTPTNKAALLRAGGIAGFMGDQSVITDCINYGGTVSTYHSNPEQQENKASQAAGIAASISQGSSVSNCIFEVGVVRTEDITDSRLVVDQSIEEYMPLNTGYYVGTAGYIYAIKEDDCAVAQCYAYNGVSFGRTGVMVTSNVTTGTDAESKAKQALIGDGSVWVEKKNGKLGLAWMVQTPVITLTSKDDDAAGTKDVTIEVKQAEPVTPRNVDPTEWEYTVEGALQGSKATPEQPVLKSTTTSTVSKVEIFEKLKSSETGVDPTAQKHYSGGTYQLYAKVTGTNISSGNTTVTWALKDAAADPSSGAQPATITDGLLKINENFFGELTVVATATGGKSAEVTITVHPAELKITTAPASVWQGGKADFAATVSGYFSGSALSATPYQVKWSVSGGVSGTTIDNNGTLTVAADETASELTVTATLAFRDGGTATAEEQKLFPTATAKIKVEKLQTVSAEVKPGATPEKLAEELRIGQQLEVSQSLTGGVPSPTPPEGYEIDEEKTTFTCACGGTDILKTDNDVTFTALKAGTETVTATLSFTFKSTSQPSVTQIVNWTSEITVTVKDQTQVTAVSDVLKKMESVNGSASTEITSSTSKAYSIQFKDPGTEEQYYKLTSTASPDGTAITSGWVKVESGSLTLNLTDSALAAVNGSGLYVWMFTNSVEETVLKSGTVGWMMKGDETTPVEGYPSEEELPYLSSVTVTGTWEVSGGQVTGSPFSALELLSEDKAYKSLAEGEVCVTVHQKSGSGTYVPREGEFLTEATASIAVGDAVLKPSIQPRAGKLPNNKFSITVPKQENIQVYYQFYYNQNGINVSPDKYPAKGNGILYTGGDIDYPTGAYDMIAIIAIAYPTDASSGGKASDPDIITYTTANLVEPNAPELVIGENEEVFESTGLYEDGQVFKFLFTPNTSGGEAYQVYYTVNGRVPDPKNGIGTLYDPSNPPTMNFGLADEIEIMAVVYDPNYGVQSSTASFTVRKLSAAAKPAASIASGSTVRPSQELMLELGESFVENLPDVSGYQIAQYAEYSADSEVFSAFEDYTLAGNSDEPIEGVRYLVLDGGTSSSSIELPTIKYSLNAEDVLADVGMTYQYAVCQYWYEVTQEEDEDTGTVKDKITYYIRYTNPDPILLEGAAGDKITVRAEQYPPAGVTSYLPSGEVSFNYTIRGSVSAPTAFPATDSTVDIGATISLFGDVNTEIYYTKDGSSSPEVQWVEDDAGGHWEPANDKTFKFEGDISVPYTTQKLFILRAIAVSANDTLESSAVTSFIYTVNPLEKAASPTASPVTDSSDPTRLANGERISLTTTTLNTDIYYTTDGSVPSFEARDAWDAAYAGADEEHRGETDGVRWYRDDEGTQYTEPATRIYDPQQGISMAASEDSEFFFVTAVAVDKNRDLPSHETSDPVSFVYRIAQVGAPTASPVTSEESVSVIEPGTIISLTSGTAGAEIYYTKDTSIPDVTDTEKVKEEYAEWLAGWNAASDYDAAEGITMPKTITTFFRIRAVAVVSDGSRADSEVVSISYQLPEPVQAVYASPVDGSAVEYGTSVTLSCSTEGAQIFYKIYTSEPGADDAPVVNQDLSYTEPITITKEVWIQAVATKSGMESAVTTYHYTVAPTADAPTISLPTGSVVPKGTRVTLAGTGTIVYTLDGSDPKADESEKQYGTAVNLDGEYGATITVRAYIQRDGYTPSDTVSYTYTICKEEDYLTISVESGSVISSGTSITLSTAVTNGQIFYTLDGSTPQVTNVYTASSSKDYTTYEWAAGSGTTAGSGFTLSGDPDSAVTVRAIAVVNGGDGGQVSTFTYKFEPQAASPTASIPSGAVVFDGAAVTLNAKEGTIYYTLDGKDPTTSSSIYTEPIDVSGSASTVLKVMAVVDGKAASEVVTYRYTRAGQAGTPVFSVTSGEIDTGTTVALSSDTDGAAIYYSTDGTTPTADNLQSLTLYVAPISVTRAVTIKAIAVSDTLDPSDVAEATYTVREPVVVPEETTEDDVVTQTVTDRLTSRRAYNSADDGPSYTDTVLRESVTNTVLSAAAGAVPDGAVLTVTQETPTRSDEASVSTSLGQTIARVYSASLTVDGDNVTPTGTVELGFAIPAEYQNGIVTVSRINDDGTLTQYTARRSGGVAYIETDSLGRFALSVTQQAQQSGFRPAWLIAGGVALALAAGFAVVLLMRRRREKAEAEAETQPYEDLADFQNFDRQ